jgi:hypothetical protein
MPVGMEVYHLCDKSILDAGMIYNKIKNAGDIFFSSVSEKQGGFRWFIPL